jgi:hypothetical protein
MEFGYMKKNSSSVNNTGINRLILCIEYSIFASSDTDNIGYNAIAGKDQKCTFSLSDEAYQNMIGALRSPETKSTYTFRLVVFLTYMGVDTLEELLRLDQKTTERRIIEYIIHLKDEKKLPYSSLEGVFAPLRKFYAMNAELGKDTQLPRCT